MSSNLVQQTQQAQAAQQQGAERAAELQRKVYGTRSEIAKALGDRIGPDRFLRALATEIRTTEHLDECTPDSVLGGLFVAAQMGLEVGRERGLVWLVPRRNNKRGGQYEATMQVGYKGWIDLFYRAGAKAVQWFLVREGDAFRIGSDSRGGKTYEWVQEDPNSARRVTGAVAQIITPSGGVVWEYMSRADIEKRSTGTNFWRDWWDEMALKTVMHRLAATAPLSDQLVLAQRSDETVQRKVPGIEQPAAQHLPLVATPMQPRPDGRTRVPGDQAARDDEGRPRPKPGPPPAARPADAAPDPAEASQYADTETDWERQQREEAEAYLAEQDRLADEAASGGNG